VNAVNASDTRRLQLLSWSFVFIWASGFIVAGLARPYADPLTFLTARYVLGIAVFVVLARVAGATWPSDRTAWRDALIAGVLLHGGYLGGVFWSIWNGMPAGLTALVTGLHPVLTAVLAIPLLHERVTPRQWAGIAIGFVGVGLVVWPAVSKVDAVPLPALAAAVFATLSFTLANIWQKRSKPAMDLRVNAAIQFIGALLVTAPVAFLIEEGRFDYEAPGLWAALLWAVLVLSVGAISLLLYLLKRGAASRVAPLLYLAPPVAAIMAVPLFGETLQPVQIAGTILTVAGALAARSRG
jgi:drug/metabolite transporter (DMT)-like permease